MTITRDTRIEYLYTVVRFLSDYANLSDDSDFFRGISQIAPEEISISSEERKNSSEVSNETSEEAVLFLKKVHSWEGITETVHGLFLLVL